jgi:alkyl hydroperoxide reductase subunit D
MALETLLAACPDYARDLKLNITNVLNQAELTPQQAWGTAVSSALASRNACVRDAILSEAAQHLSPEAMRAARAAASIMGMNNVYYRFQKLSGNPRYGEIPARLRMQVIRGHGGDPVDFELWCLAVSAINGCGSCVESHEAVLRGKGVPEETILAAVRIASVVNGLATAIESA